jgi:hypothetical protein
MLKITLPNGVVIEGDDANELGQVVQNIIAPSNNKKIDAPPVQRVNTLPVVNTDEQEIQADLKSSEGFPHRYAPNNKRAIALGPREDRCLQIAKMICEIAEHRGYRFRTKEIFKEDGAPSIHSTGSALQGLKHKGLIKHDEKNNRLWYITDRGWNSCFRPSSEVEAVRPTT